MKKYWRFLSFATILVIILATIIGAGAVSAQTVCSPATAISVPFVKDGPGDFCWVSTSLCTAINSWSTIALEINGTSYKNQWVPGSSIPALNGTYTIHYNGGSFSHFEINGPCSGSATNTPPPGVTNTPTRTATAGTTTPTITSTALTGSFPDLVISSVVSSPPGWTGGCATTQASGIRVAVRNNGNVDTGPFVVDANGAQQTVSGGLAVGASINLWFTGGGNFTVTVDATGMVAESQEGNNTRSYVAITGTPPVLCTRTPTPGVAGDLGFGTVNGTITNANTGAPIAGAVVTCSHTAYNPTSTCSGTRTTGADGTYVFSNVFFHDTDRITVSVSASGYVSQTTMKTPFTTPNMTANFALVPGGGVTPPTSTRTATRTNTPTRTRTATNGPSPTRTNTIMVTPPINTPIPSKTPTLPGGICSPVEADIAAPFMFSFENGQTTIGTHCWRSNNLGTFVNSFNTSNLSINGVNFTNLWASSASLPAQIDGYWYISYWCQNAHCHFEVGE